MTFSSSQGTFEVSERNYLESAYRGRRRTETFTLSRLQVLLCVIIVISLIAVTGILTAMFGPGTKDLKYRDPEDCKGKCSEYLGYKQSLFCSKICRELAKEAKILSVH